MAKNEEKDAASEGSDLRYRYIGFEVYGPKIDEFFKSDQERREYQSRVEEYAKTHYSPLRSGTAVQAALLTKLDRLVLTLTSIGLIIGGILPWFSVSSVYGSFNVLGLTAFLSISRFSGILSQFSGMISTLAYVFSILALAGAVFGVLTLLSLYAKSKSPESAFLRLKRILLWQYIPLVAWFVLAIYLIVGIEIPFGEAISDIYMIKGLGPKFNIGTFWAIAQPGMWLTICALIINAVKSNEL